MFPTSISLGHLLLITTFLLLIHCNFVKSDAQLIEKTCKQTPYYGSCVSFLKSRPESFKTDVDGLALIMVGIVEAKSKATQSLIRVQLKKSPGLKRPLSFCADEYDAILTADIPEAKEALEKGNPKFAQDGMRDAANASDQCEVNFHGGSPLSGLNKVVHVSSSIAAAIVQLLL
uniref:Invertase inhibitor n=1 Tax=Rhizophora mucronata TaxID=61149 RepID=A0A2P2P605_RHIMU